MAKRTNTQIATILNMVAKQIHADIEKKVNAIPKMFQGNLYLDEAHALSLGAELRWHHNNKLDGGCDSKEEKAAAYGKNNDTIPQSWYEEEFEAGNYEVVKRKVGCSYGTGSRAPRYAYEVEFTNEEKERKRVSASKKKEYLKHYTNASERSEEINCLVVESNAWLKDFTARLVLGISEEEAKTILKDARADWKKSVSV